MTDSDFPDSDFPDYYAELEIDSSANSESIRRAYKSLSQRFHPDKNPKDSDRYFRIRKAYEVLSDPIRKAAYDCGIRQGINPQEFSMHLDASVERVVLHVLGKLEAFEGAFGAGQFDAECLARIDKELAELATEQQKIEKKKRFVKKHLESIEQGDDTYLARALVKKSVELSTIEKGLAVRVAVLEYLQSDTERLRCKKPNEQWTTLPSPEQILSELAAFQKDQGS